MTQERRRAPRRRKITESSQSAPDHAGRTLPRSRPTPITWSQRPPEPLERQRQGRTARPLEARGHDRRTIRARPKTCGDMPRCGWAITNPSARPKTRRRLFARWRRRPLPQRHIRASSAARRISLLCPGANIHLIDFLKQHPFESAKREEYAHRHRLGE